MINWGVPLREYLPYSEERIKHLREVVNHRPVAILAAGPSIKQLEERVQEIADEDICYFGLNKFTQEKYILNQVGKRFSLLMASDRECIPPVMNEIVSYLNRNDDNIFLSSLWRDTFGLVNLDVTWFVNVYNRKLLFFSLDFANDIPNAEKPLHFTVGNSLQILIQIALIGGASSVILFGADGGYKPEDKECYYRQGEYWEQVGLNTALLRDTKVFNATMPTSIDNVYRTYDVPRIDILNCTDNSLYTPFSCTPYDKTFDYIKKGER